MNHLPEIVAFSKYLDTEVLRATVEMSEWPLSVPSRVTRREVDSIQAMKPDTFHVYHTQKDASLYVGYKSQQSYCRRKKKREAHISLKIHSGSFIDPSRKLEEKKRRYLL